LHRRAVLPVLILSAVAALPGADGSLQAQARPRPVVLSYPANVRSAGLAGAGAAMLGYAGSVFNNPSGLAPIRALSLEGSFARLPDRSTYVMSAAAVRAGQFNLGGGVQYLRLAADEPVYDNLSVAGAAVYRRGGISLGAAGKYVSLEDSAGAVSRAVTTDLSATVAFFDIAAVALSVQNVGDWTVTSPGLDLPRSTHLGFSFNVLDSYSNGRLLLAVETVWRQGQERRTVIGLEGGVVFYGVGLVARVGTGGEPGTPIKPLSSTTYGGSVVGGQARFDYAYQKRSALGRGVHLFGVRWTP
jgi:hypothetical protein